MTCFYANDQFCLVKWPGGSYWAGWGQNYCSPWVQRYEMADVRKQAEKGHGCNLPSIRVWDCARDADGPLTLKRKGELIKREIDRERCTACDHPFRENEPRVTVTKGEGATHKECYW